MSRRFRRLFYLLGEDSQPSSQYGAVALTDSQEIEGIYNFLGFTDLNQFVCFYLEADNVYVIIAMILCDSIPEEEEFREKIKLSTNGEYTEIFALETVEIGETFITPLQGQENKKLLYCYFYTESEVAVGDNVVFSFGGVDVRKPVTIVVEE